MLTTNEIGLMRLTGLIVLFVALVVIARIIFTSWLEFSLFTVGAWGLITLIGIFICSPRER